MSDSGIEPPPPVAFAPLPAAPAPLLPDAPAPLRLDAPAPLRLDGLRERLRSLGAGAAHERLLLRDWLAARPADRPPGRREPTLPRAVAGAWPALRAALDGLATLASAHPAEDGERLLVRLADGQTVESVLLPRGGLCVSSQLGCAVGCRFCMTGQGGLLRQLGSAEIVAQVVLARRRRAVRKVVFMGMGEPAHNLEAVLEAIELLGTLGGIGHKSLVFSTVGDPRAFERLMALAPGRVRPALAISLHTTREALRRELLPFAPPMSPRALVEAADAYGRASGHPVQVQWTLLDGVNDGAEEMEAAAALLAGRRMVLNLIPYNTVEGLPWQRPPIERSAALARELHRRGVLTKLRRSAAQSVDGGCGQLRARLERTGEAVVALRGRRGALQPPTGG